MKWRPMVIYRWSRRQRLPFQTTKIRLDSCHRYHRRCVPPKCFSRWAYFQVPKQSNCIYIVAIVLQFLFVLLCLLYLFSSIYCSIERSSNYCNFFCFVLLPPHPLSSSVFPSRFYCHFISMCSSLILFALFAVVFYTVSYVYVLIWTQSQLHATAHETFLFFGLHTHQQTHTNTCSLYLYLYIALTHSHTANTKVLLPLFSIFQLRRSTPTINQSINRIPLKIIPISQTVVH